jgi:electron transport complex protein RnfG
MNKIVKLAVILFAVSAIVALCLGLVNSVTADRIAAIAAEKLATAMSEVLPADEYTDVEYTGDDQNVDFIKKAGDKGWVVQCTVSGSQGSITMLTGVAADGTVTGISVLDHGETPGLGAIAGAAVVLVLCWAVIRFAPAENVGLLSLHCLQQSQLGQLLVPLFLGPTL